MTEPTALERLVTVDQLAEHVGVSTRTLHHWRVKKGMPHYGGGGSALRFRVSEVEEWMRGNGPEHSDRAAA